MDWWVHSRREAFMDCWVHSQREAFMDWWVHSQREAFIDRWVYCQREACMDWRVYSKRSLYGLMGALPERSRFNILNVFTLHPLPLLWLSLIHLLILFLGFPSLV